MEIHICSITEYNDETRMPTIANPNDKTFYLVPTEDGTSPDLFTEWIYVNDAWEMFGSASIDLTDYVKNTDIATTTKAGVVKINPTYGVGIFNDTLVINGALANEVKAGNNSTKAVSTYRQHESTFYGLAKAAGHDEKDSTLPVGQYTDEAKSSIQDMLDVPSNADLDEVEEKVEQNTEDLLKAFPVETASGSIASFEDGADGLPLKSLVVDINPIQDLHGYDSPWVGGGGKNLCPPLPSQTANGITITTDADGVSHISGTATSTKDFMIELPSPINGTFTFSANNSVALSGTNTYFGLLDSNNNSLGSSTLIYANRYRTVTGEIAKIKIRFQTGLEIPNGFTVALQLEEGSTATDYAPYENICPISGRTEVDVEQSGINLFNKATVVTGYIDDSSGALKTQGLGQKSKATDYISVKPNASYYISSEQTKGAWGAWYDKDKNYVAGIAGYMATTSDAKKTKTAPSNAYYMRLTVEYYESGTVNGNVDTFSINYPSSDHDYHPYTGRSITINWQTEAGTVYGGKLDVLSGELTVEKAKVTFDGSEGWAKNADATTLFTLHLNYPNLVNFADNTDENVRVISDKLIGTSARIATSASSRKGYQIAVISNSRFYVVMPQTKEPYITNASDFKAWLANNPVTVCYELETPIEIQLTPQEVNSLLGANNIWADTGDIEVEYRADTELYINKTNINDVQINGTSIVNNNVANIPLATANISGLVKADVHANGYRGGIATIDNKLYVVGSALEGIKYGGDYSKPVVAGNQHQSTFYGLAKAAGADEKDSTLAFGTYSDNAKSSIQNMLGITDKYSPKEWVAESETELVTNAHSVGDLFYIGETLYKVITDLNAGDAINVGVNVEEVNVNDILDDYATKEDVQDNVSIVEKSASGATASFTDGADGIPLKSLIVNIEPVQDLHGQENPYPAGGGKNLWGFIADDFAESTFYGQAKFIDVTLPEGTYTISSNAPTGYIWAGLNIPQASSRVFEGTPKTVTLSSGDVLSIGVSRDYTGTALSYNNQIELGSTATAYSPYSNICPISGWTQVDVEQRGVNVWDEEWEVGGLSTMDGRPSANNNAIRSKNFIPCLPNTDYYTKSVNLACYLWFYDGNKNFISFVTNNVNKAVTTPSNCRYMKLRIGDSGNPLQTYNHDISINYPSTDHDYHPYTGRSITINFGQTVYGGKLDVLSGVLRVEMAMLDMGSLIWTYDNTSYAYGFFIATVTTKKVGSSNLVCSQYKTIHGGRNMLTSNATICPYNITNSNSVCVRDDAYTDATVFRTAMSGVQLCYELKTPIEIQLTPHEVNSLLGVNNIFADTGDTEVEYFSQVDKDLIDYIKTSLKPYAKEERLNDYVSDVQINGTSIVTDGVANVPIASLTSLGLMKVGSGLMVSSSGIVKILPSDNDLNKIGTDINRPITPSTQHSSTFYGLTKAAGVDMSSSSNVVGIYTDEAKTAIKQMLGVHDTYDSFVEEITGTDVTITGQPSYRYNCGEVLSLSITPPESGTIDIRFTSGSTPTVLTLPQTVKMPEWWVEVEANTIYEMCITDGIYCGVMTWAI